MMRAASPARKAVAYGALFPVGVGYYAGLVAGRTARPLFAQVALWGVPAADVRALGSTYASEVIPQTIRPMALEQLAWHRRNGDKIVVVSGSLAVYVRPWCEREGLERIATELEERNGQCTGRYLGGECTGLEKAVRIRKAYDLSRFQHIYAYGDTAEDLEMLALARHQIYRWQGASELRSAG